MRCCGCPRAPAPRPPPRTQVVGACAAGDLTPTSQFSAAHQQISATQSASTRRTAETAKAQLAEIARARKRHGELRTAHIKTLQNAIASSTVVPMAIFYLKLKWNLAPVLSGPGALLLEPAHGRQRHHAQLRQHRRRGRHQHRRAVE
eukprot:COSAG04_NODE_7667_length_1090_cov_0.790111_1_plen_146_part_10